MSAEALGDELYGAVKQETLDVLLRSLRGPSSVPGDQTGVPAIDRLLSVLQNPPIARPQQQYQSTQCSTQAATINAPPPTIVLPPIIEITGASPCSSKTQLLYYSIANTLLPLIHNGISINGREQAVVLLDLSSKFSILRLRDVIYSHCLLKSSASTDPMRDGEITALIHSSLTHLHVFRPFSTPNLLATLKTIPDYLLAQPSNHFSANRPVGLFVINDISAFYQQDCLDSEEAKIMTVPTETTTLLQSRYHTLTTALREIQILFSATILATNHALSTPTNRGAGLPSLRPHLPAVWANFVTVPIVIERDRVTRFGPGMSIEEANGEKAERWDAVQRSGFSGWINWWGAGGWREEVRESIRALEAGGRFTIQIRGERVIVDDGIESRADDQNPPLKLSGNSSQGPT